MTNYNERLDDVLDTLVENAADSDSRLGYVEAYEHAEKAKQAILSDLLEIIDIVEPCVPDCDEVRHARHQGQWEMHLKLADKVRKYCE